MRHCFRSCFRIEITAVDFDFGPQRAAYFDRDSASYQYTPGVNTRGNRGRAYRNDGVDIANGKDGYHIFSIEDGEWLQYTITVRKEGQYKIALQVSSDTLGGKIAILNNEKPAGPAVSIMRTGGAEEWEYTSPITIFLKQGINRLRVRADAGKFNLKALRFYQ